MDTNQLIFGVSGLLMATLTLLYALRGWVERQKQATLREETEYQEKLRAREAAKKQRMEAEATTGGTTGGGSSVEADLDLPPWLIGVAEGVGLDPAKLAAGDPAQWQQAMKIADQVVPEKWKKRAQKQASDASVADDGVMVLG